MVSSRSSKKSVVGVCGACFLVAIVSLYVTVLTNNKEFSNQRAATQRSKNLPWSVKQESQQNVVQSKMRLELEKIQQELQTAEQELSRVAGEEMASMRGYLAKALEALEEEREQFTYSFTTKAVGPIDMKKKKKGEAPMNILLLYADDWRHDSLGSASNGLVQTPFLDHLAEEGMRFTHNCVTTSVCWVSRATLYTGQYVSRHNSTESMQPEFYKRWNETIISLLREGGYYYGHIGKWHFRDYFDFVKPKFDWERMYYGRHYIDPNVHVTKQNEEDALRFLQERPTDKPFFLSVCFFAPHAHDGEPEQYLPQNKSKSLYVNDTIPVAPSASGDEGWRRMPEFFSKKNEGRNRYFWRFDTPEKYQKMMKNYYRLITEVDSASEKIVEELKKQGLYDDTLIIFTTDNGYFHAEHGLADKFYPYQESIRVPLIIRDPRNTKKRGSVSDEFTLNIDLAPTILAAANITIPDYMQGRDLADLYTSASKQNWRQEFFYEHPIHINKETVPASEALVRKDYKYMMWPDYDLEQLFDLKKDVYEMNDLINSTDHQELLVEMRARFQELKQAAK